MTHILSLCTLYKTLSRYPLVMRNRYLLTLTFLLVALGVKAQSGKLYTVDRELSSSLINDIYQDHNQLIWIATEDGLNRYDGSKFTIYKREDGNENSLLN